MILSPKLVCGRSSVYGRDSELTLSSGNECPTGHIPMVDPITTGTL